MVHWSLRECLNHSRLWYRRIFRSQFWAICVANNGVSRGDYFDELESDSDSDLYVSSLYYRNRTSSNFRGKCWI